MKRIKIKNYVLKCITWVAVFLFIAAACAIDCTTSMVPVYILFACLAWFVMFSIANGFFGECGE